MTKKEIQDKVWNDLPAVTKKEYIEKYKAYCASEFISLKNEYEDIFGEHNLNVKEVKHWLDIEHQFPEIKHELLNIQSQFHHIPYLVGKKLLATFQISQIIELGYGKMITEDEWKKNSGDFIGVYYNPKIDDFDYRVPMIYHFITFHNRKLAEEFMSYLPNRNLIKNYYMF